MFMPRLGLGTRQLTDAQCTSTIQHALDLGYRHIDTASVYHNEAIIGSAWTESGAQRQNLWLTTKLFINEYKSKEIIEHSIKRSLLDLQTDYIDLVLLHRPTTLEEHHFVFDILLNLKEKGIIRNIGVSNFTSAQLLDAVTYTWWQIYAYQWEYHICLNQSKILTICQDHDIIFEAYCPLAHGKLWWNEEIMNQLKKIAIKHEMTVAQVMLARLRQQGVTILPKSTQYEHLIDNMTAKHMILDEEDNKVIAWFPKNFRYCNPAQIAPQRD